jgi:purine-binding chemotaxis protein CheW
MDEARLMGASDVSGPWEEGQMFVTFIVAAQCLGVPVSCVQDILVPERIARDPRAPAVVRGCINLRGRAAKVIDMRARLELPVRGDAKLGMGVTVEHRGELYMLLADRIGDVVCPPPHASDDKPLTLDAAWREVTSGVYRLDDGVMVVLDIDRLLDFS